MSFIAGIVSDNGWKLGAFIEAASVETKKVRAVVRQRRAVVVFFRWWAGVQW